MKTKNYYRDVIYFWIIIFMLPMLSAIVCGALLVVGGENSHLQFYMQGYVNGNSLSTLKLEDIKGMMFVLGGMSLFFNLTLFTKERREIISDAPVLQAALFIVLLILAAFLYNNHLQRTLLEIQDETFNYQGILAVIYYGSASIIFTSLSFIYSIIKILPAAKKLDAANFSNLLNFKS